MHLVGFTIEIYFINNVYVQHGCDVSDYRTYVPRWPKSVDWLKSLTGYIHTHTDSMVIL